MTTQVVLMNGLGVALASDSAVTAGGKVLNTSEKIFELPSPHKAALLTSGRAEVMGIPWEVVFSAWSETLDRPLSSILEYRESLYKFLRSISPDSGRLTSAEKDYLMSSYWGEENVVGVVLDTYRDVVTTFFESVLEGNQLERYRGNEWDADFRSEMTAMITQQVADEFSAKINQAIAKRRGWDQSQAEGISEAQALIWIQKYWSQVETSPQFDFPSWPEIPNFDSLVMNLHATYIVYPSDGDSNVNIVGFGVGDLFPSIAGTFVLGCVRGTIIKRWEGDAEASNAPRNFFFGQDEAISAIFRGDDGLLSKTAAEASKKAFQDIYEQLGDSQDQSVVSTKEFVKAALESDSITQQLRNAGRENREKPFRKAIGMAPILDLAEFSAGLVGVQAAAAQMTQENPSVGGVVDVAIITHRRGFEWIRRKH